MEDKVENPRVIFDCCLSFEHHIKSLCSRLNGTLSYLNRVKNTLDQKSWILLINGRIFSRLNYCSSIWGKCSEKLPYGAQKCINFAAKVISNGKYLKRDHVTPLLRDLKWINFNSILRLNEHPPCIKICMLQQTQMWKRLTLTSETWYHREWLETALMYIYMQIIEEQQWDKKLSKYLEQSCWIRSRLISEIQIPSLRSKVYTPYV